MIRINLMSFVSEDTVASSDKGTGPDRSLEDGSLLFVNGTLMRGLALHPNLDGATFLEEVPTAPRYRIHSIADQHPGMYQVESGGVAVLGELYRLSDDVLDRVVRGEPPGLFVGPVELADGRVVPGVLFDRERIRPVDRDISASGGWRAYLARDPGRDTTRD
jgi:AGZA family xanthine/uracil permease-like MFS transporter